MFFAGPFTLTSPRESASGWGPQRSGQPGLASGVTLTWAEARTVGVGCDGERAADRDVELLAHPGQLTAGTEP